MSEIKWSYSKLKCLKECPKQFYFKYIKKIFKEVKSDALAIGTGIHAFIEYYAANRSASLYECEQAYIQGVDRKTLKNTIAIDKHTRLVKSYISSGKVLVPLLHNGELMTEKRFEFTYKSTSIIGYIDIITDDGVVADYKTSGYPYTSKMLKEADQLSVYAAAYNHLLGKELTTECKVGYQVILKDNSGVQNLLDGIRKPHQITKVLEDFKACDDFVQANNDYKSKKGKACDWCGYKEECVDSDATNACF